MGKDIEKEKAREPETAVSGEATKGCSCGFILAVVAIIGVAIALLWPPLGTPRASRRMICSNNLKQIALALHNYHDEYESFPPAYVADETGKPMHSWRVLILPFIEQQHLYDQYNFDEPWDGPSNRQLIEQAPTIYTCPSFPDDKNKSRNVEEPLTQYFTVSGPHTAFPGTTAVAFRDILDGTSNALMVVECHTRHIAWTAPIDISPDELVQSLIVNDPLSSHPGGFQVALADGSVRFIADTIEPETLRRLLTIDDGELISDRDW